MTSVSLEYSFGAKRTLPVMEGTDQTDQDILRLLETLESIRPVGQEQWVTVQDVYNAQSRRSHRPEREWSALRDKWNRMIRHPKPTGDPECPEVCLKIIFNIRNRTDSNVSGGSPSKTPGP